MEQKRNIFDFAGAVLCTFGFMTIMMLIFTFFLGESVKGLSSMFRLGSRGIASETLVQYLVLAILVTAVRYFFCLEKVRRHVAEPLRDLLMLGMILLVIIFFIIRFGWFPVHMWQPWVLFGICFLICFLVSLWIMLKKTKIENELLEENLESLKARWKEEQDGKCS